MTDAIVGLIGNPNSGKSTLFNALTGGRARVGNWPGVTVERRSGRWAPGDRRIELIDLPGTYALDATPSASLDEIIARDFVASGGADVIVNVLDATAIERGLYLTFQLLEMRVPLVVAVNRMDLARREGIRIDLDRLAERLGCPVVPLVASRGEGTDRLGDTVAAMLDRGPMRGIRIEYPEVIEHALRELGPRLGAPARKAGVDPRWLGLALLEGDPGAAERIGPEERARVDEARRQAERHLDEPIDVYIAETRYAQIHAVASACVRQRGRIGRSLSDRIDRVLLNRFVGVPVFLAAMYLLFVASYNGGAVFLDFFDQAAGVIFVDGTAAGLHALDAPRWLVVLLADAVGGAIQLVATFVAPIAMTFFFLALLEDSGYMARAAFVMDRLMRRIGLPGKAFVPMVIGFGCNVPAVMATRTLENPRERLVAALMQPFMSCNARLVIYMAFVAVFFHDHGGQIVFSLYLLGIVMAVLTALVLNRTALRGEATPFVMELPAYQLPTLRGLLATTWERLRVFVLGVGKVIIVASVVITALSSFSPKGEVLGPERIGDSVLGETGKALTPVFAPMGLDEENWPEAVGLLTGVVVKEVVLGTLNTIHQRLGAGEDDHGRDEATPWQPIDGLVQALATIPENAAALLSDVTDPLGLSSLGRLEEGQAESLAAEQGLDQQAFNRLGAYMSAPAALAYLVFILLYIPCVNTMAAIYRETGSRGWTAFSVLWGTGLAWAMATLVYQFAHVGAHPLRAVGWAAVILAAFAVVVRGLRMVGDRRELAA
jgi:ferrous iron transport protein B